MAHYSAIEERAQREAAQHLPLRDLLRGRLEATEQVRAVQAEIAARDADCYAREAAAVDQLLAHIGLQEASSCPA